jgi:chaperonin GroES
MRIKPCGYFVLVDITEAEHVTSGGIVLPTELVEKEQMAEETGTIVAFGPTCFVGWRGCEREDIPAYEQWGLKVGDKVEFRKFEGKRSFVKGYEKHRYIPDTHILGVINDG